MKINLNHKDLKSYHVSKIHQGLDIFLSKIHDQMI